MDRTGVLVVWTDLIFPNGFTLNLGGMSGSDQAGQAGFRDRRNGHTGKIFGAAILTSLLGTGVRYGSGVEQSNAEWWHQG
jgi:type IV secretion system protein VirB10